MRAIPDPGSDLVVRGGTVVTAGGSAECDLGVTGGKISQIGGALRGGRELDATGALVLPAGWTCTFTCRRRLRFAGRSLLRAGRGGLTDWAASRPVGA